eukprot:gene11255-15103_t
MGVPKFFRWATDRYPGILSKVIFDLNEDVPGVDNFYLDMNGLIHQCSHVDSELTLLDENTIDKIMQKILNELNNLVTIIRPKYVLYIAIDGVAPRAKLNQQRARRFRAGCDRQLSVLSAIERGVLPQNTAIFDSNCITPGTTFMFQLSEKLKNFIDGEIRTNINWMHLKVFLSGSEVPGEGEHKIIAFIRELRATANHLPNVRHCIYGADADMIMLALATHEPYFLILREVLNKPQSNKASKREKKNNAKNTINDSNNITANIIVGPNSQRLQFIRINVLRDYLIREFFDDILNESDSLDRERVIDDFVFLTFLIGNDFLPHLPGLDIGDNAFDILFDAYKNVMSTEQGYLTECGTIDLNKLEFICTIVGVTELSLYEEKEINKSIKNRYAISRASRDNSNNSHKSHNSDNSNNHTGKLTPSIYNEIVDEFISKSVPREDYRQIYYQVKLGITVSPTSIFQTSDTSNNIEVIHSNLPLLSVIQCYVEGLLWCLAYYTQGCISWSWFYPFHYGPFLQDMIGLDLIKQNILFELDHPFTPYQQLLACLPSSSCYLLPKQYHWLMSDTSSPLISYYPFSFSTDLNGKRNDWEAVVLLPFINKNELLDAEKRFCLLNEFSFEEKKRNEFGNSWCYYNTSKFENNNNNDSNKCNNLKSERIEVCEIPYIILPTAPFASSLIAGTLDTLPKYPNIDELTVEDFTKRSVKSSNKNKKTKVRKNFFSDDINAESNFKNNLPMLGKNSNNMMSNYQIKLLFNDEMNFMMIELIKFIQLNDVYFSSPLMNNSNRELTILNKTNPSSSLLSSSPNNQKYSGCKLFGINYQFIQPNHMIYKELQQNILPKVAMIFGPVTGKITSKCMIDPINNEVMIKYFESNDNNPLQQIEEYIYYKLYKQNLPKKSQFNKFSRYFSIGIYEGNEPQRFLEKLTEHLKHIEPLMCEFSCKVIQVVNLDSNELYGSHYSLVGGENNG